MKNTWYAVLRDAEDNDWGYGSFDWDEAVEMAKGLGDEAIIAEIKGEWDEEDAEVAGSDPISIAEYHAGVDF